MVFGWFLIENFTHTLPYSLAWRIHTRLGKIVVVFIGASHSTLFAFNSTKISAAWSLPIVSSFKCCCVSDRSVYETYRDGLCYSVVKMEILSPIELDFRLFAPNRTFSPPTCLVRGKFEKHLSRLLLQSKTHESLVSFETTIFTSETISFFGSLDVVLDQNWMPRPSFVPGMQFCNS